jgi:hypothetical protein
VLGAGKSEFSSQWASARSFHPKVWFWHFTSCPVEMKACPCLLASSLITCGVPAMAASFPEKERTMEATETA